MQDRGGGLFLTWRWFIIWFLWTRGHQKSHARGFRLQRRWRGIRDGRTTPWNSWWLPWALFVALRTHVKSDRESAWLMWAGADRGFETLSNSSTMPLVTKDTERTRRSGLSGTRCTDLELFQSSKIRSARIPKRMNASVVEQSAAGKFNCPCSKWICNCQNSGRN